VRAVKTLLMVASMTTTLACGAGGDRFVAPAELDPFDGDRDGHVRTDQGGDDCADDDPRAHGAAAESCDGRDEDCDGRADEDFECVAGSARACGRIPGYAEKCGVACSWGPCEPDLSTPSCMVPGGQCAPGERSECEHACGSGTRLCGTDCRWGACDGPLEVCDGLDNDCDGAVDEGTFGLTSALTPLPWVGTTYAIRASGTPGGEFAVLQATFRSTPEAVVLSWVDRDRRPLVDGEVVFDDVQRVEDMRLITAGEGAAGAVVYHRAGDGTFVVGMLLASSAGLGSVWSIDRLSVHYRIAWTGAELVVVSDDRISLFDADGQALGEPAEAPISSVPVGDPPWTGDALVLADAGRLIWVDVSGTVLRERDLGVERIGGVSVVPDGLIVAYREGRQIGLARLDLDGEEQWRAEAPVNESLEPAAALPIAEGWVVPDVLGDPGFGAWVVRADGVPLGDPAWWGAIPVPFPISVAVATDGLEALQFVSSDGVSAASVGCVAPAVATTRIQRAERGPSSR